MQPFSRLMKLLKDGPGIMTYPDGAVHEGMFARDLANGPGTLLSADGTRYTGEYLNGKKHGHGRLKEPGSAEIEGNWSDNALVESSEPDQPAKSPGELFATAEMIPVKTFSREETPEIARPIGNHTLPAPLRNPSPHQPNAAGSRITVSKIQIQTSVQAISPSSEEMSVILVKAPPVNLRSSPDRNTAVLAR